MKKTSKATLARVNAEQPATLYQMLFARLLSRCQLKKKPGKMIFFRPLVERLWQQTQLATVGLWNRRRIRLS